MSDHEDAARYAAAAGAVLVELRAREGGEGVWGGPLGDAGDEVANRCLLELLARDHPDDAVLSEESVDDHRRLEADRVWIVDPLDGTREFSEPGRTDWAVHVALWERDVGVRTGAVALPAAGRVLSTADRLTLPERAGGGRPRIVVSRTRPPVEAARVASALDAEVVTMGSAGAKTMAVVLGAVDAYVHAGGQYEWDSAAPIAVADRAGLHTSRLDGTPLVYNRARPWLPDLIVCRPELTEAILAITAP
jgi:3'(2'), 5'-bisphosphate nucleotidase